MTRHLRKRAQRELTALVTSRPGWFRRLFSAERLYQLQQELSGEKQARASLLKWVLPRPVMNVYLRWKHDQQRAAAYRARYKAAGVEMPEWLK